MAWYSLFIPNAVHLQRTFLFFILKIGAFPRPDMLGAVGSYTVRTPLGICFLLDINPSSPYLLP